MWHTMFGQFRQVKLVGTAVSHYWRVTVHPDTINKFSKKCTIHYQCFMLSSILQTYLWSIHNSNSNLFEHLSLKIDFSTAGPDKISICLYGKRSHWLIFILSLFSANQIKVRSDLQNFGQKNEFKNRIISKIYHLEKSISSFKIKKITF